MVRPRPCSSLANRGVESSPYFPPLVKYKTRAGKYTQSKSKEKLLASLKSREVGGWKWGIPAQELGDSGSGWILDGVGIKTYLKRWRVICSPLNKRFQNAIYNENQKAKSGWRKDIQEQEAACIKNSTGTQEESQINCRPCHRTYRDTDENANVNANRDKHGMMHNGSGLVMPTIIIMRVPRCYIYGFWSIASGALHQAKPK